MKMKVRLLAAAIALAGAAHAQADGRGDDDHRGTKVFVIAMENHNWTQPGTQTSPQQIFLNPAAPFINSLVNGEDAPIADLPAPPL